MDKAIVVILIVLTIINWRIYHRLFRVVYFNLGRGLFTEIFWSLMAAILEYGLLATVFVKILGFLANIFSFLGGVVAFILKLGLVLAVVSIVVLAISKVIALIKGNSTSASTDFEENKQDYAKDQNQMFQAQKEVCHKCGQEISNGARFCVFCGSPIIDMTEEKEYGGN